MGESHQSHTIQKRYKYMKATPLRAKLLPSGKYSIGGGKVLFDLHQVIAISVKLNRGLKIVANKKPKND